MLRSLCCFALLVICVSARAAIVVPLAPAGDGTFFDSTGSSYDFFSSGETANSAHYSYYGTSDTYSSQTSFAQFALPALSADDIVAVTLNVNLLGRYLTAPTVSCGSIMHLSNSSAATGNASQRLSGDQLVARILLTTPLGANAFDVTDYVKNDISAGRAWSVFSFERDGTGDYSNRNAGFSVSSAETALGPYLSIVVPEPTTLGLVALAALALTRRR